MMAGREVHAFEKPGDQILSGRTTQATGKVSKSIWFTHRIGVGTTSTWSLRTEVVAY